ncbi:hypothetical protein [Ruegeria lacuscaerulensis]|uniref:hypothetical protein n=1 Tax=Ruegeria lacuscaerulensis TaxID=55218 RepID=UPI00147D8B34|nr:hypothetical protein [Ruegeria lacuscaerulensis]
MEKLSMLRTTLNLTGLCLLGLLACVSVLMLGFFASPEAVRAAPPAQYNSLLLQALPQR